MLITNHKKQKGFTLIEMLVSVALFSIVVTATLGAILTIADSNKKARSLMSVTNNLNFAIDSMTRSIKSGQMSSAPLSGANNKCFTTEQINYSNTSESFGRENVRYCFEQDADGNGRIEQTIGSNILPLTSADVDIDYLTFTASELGGNQTRVLIVIGGTVKVSEKISSSFSIQTTVSQRKLNLTQ